MVIPCYNYGRFLGQAVTSALTQTGVAVDVIVVDDASLDDSLAVAESFANRNGAVRILSHHTNQGAVQTFNDGLGLAGGRYVVRLDADDLLTPGALERAVAVMEAHPEVGLVYGRPVHFATAAPPERSRSRVLRWTIWDGRQWLADRCRTGVNVITSPEVVMRRSLVQRVGGQQPLKHAHDMEMWLRLAAFGDVAHLDGPDQAWHREHCGSLSEQLGGPLESLVERRAAFSTLFAGIVSEIPESAALHAASSEALAAEALDRACRIYDRNQYDGEAIDALLEFAFATHPEVEALAEWRALRRRARLGQSGVRRRPWYVARAASRRASEELRRAWWTSTGVYGLRSARRYKEMA